MPRMYTVAFDAVTVASASGDYDFFEFDAATDLPIELCGWKFNSLSEIQEAQEEWMRCSVVRGHTTTGNGTSTTPRPVSPADSAAGFTAKTVGSTPASAGTAVTLDTFGVNVRAGDALILPEGMGYWTSGASLLCIRLLAAVTDDLTLSGTAWVREYP